jgi:hypothetical protein
MPRRHPRERERWHYRRKIGIAAGKRRPRVQAGSKPARLLGRRMNVSGRPQTPMSSAPARRRRESYPRASAASWKYRPRGKVTRMNAAMSPAAGFCGGTHLRS